MLQSSEEQLIPISLAGSHRVSAPLDLSGTERNCESMSLYSGNALDDTVAGRTYELFQAAADKRRKETRAKRESHDVAG